MANEQDRSKVILIDPRAKTETYKRSNHNDFATTAELKQRGFSGWRENKIEAVAELWVNGVIERRVTAAEIVLDPNAIDKAHRNFFQID